LIAREQQLGPGLRQRTSRCAYWYIPGDTCSRGGHDVEPAELGDPVVERRRQRVAVPDIDPAGDDSAVEGPDLR
jgi:hypothetical protein